MGLSTTYTKAETDFLLQQIDKKVVGGYKGDLRISDPAPTEIGYYMLLDVGTYANLDGLNTILNRLNFASFDGTTWSKVEVAIPTSSLGGGGTLTLANTPSPETNSVFNTAYGSAAHGDSVVDLTKAKLFTKTSMGWFSTDITVLPDDNIVPSLLPSEIQPFK